MTDDFDRAALFRSWVHAHEEDSGESLVFRPADTPMPPSRGRRSLDLSSEGEAGVGFPGPDDRRTIGGGSWSVEGRRLLVRHASGTELFEIEALEPDRLVLRPTGE
jgi:hypothetical protein